LQKGFTTALVLLLVLLLAVPAFAAVTTGKVGIAPRAGFFLTGGEWKIGPMFGADIKFGLHQHWAVGVSGMYGPASGGMFDMTGDLPTIVEADEDDNKLKIRHHIVELAGFYNINPVKEAVFYLTAGIGVDSWRVRDNNGDKVYVSDLNGESFEFRDQQLTLMFGAGIEYFPIDEFSFGGTLRYHVLTGAFSQFKDDRDVGGSDGLDNPSGVLELGVMLTAYFGSCKDGDRDGVCDDDDLCPETPYGCIIDTNGCEIDSDGDGVCDGIDTCAATPTGCSVDAYGCDKDGDGDGVCDGVDKCPNTPKEAKVDADGCPLDTDRDGIPDYLDTCPGTLSGCVVDQKGCPVDSDGDGVCDGIDECPGDPNNVLEVDSRGCPTAFHIEPELILVGVVFPVNAANLDDQAKAYLDGVVKSLQALPHVKVEVQGHTDVSGNRDKNIALSLKRAQSVADYFASQGIDAGRLEVKGYGPDKPKFDNATAEGRKQNRRVELKRLN